MPNLEYDFNNDDYQLIANDTSNIQLSNNDYVRITLYTINEGNKVSNQIYQYSVDGADTEIVNQKAVFYSSLNPFGFKISISPFFTGTQSTSRVVGGEDNDFKIYQRDEENNTKKYFLKPNELFNSEELPEGNYSIKIDFIQQLNPTNITPEYLAALPQPQYISEVDINNDDNLDLLDAIQWAQEGRPDISYYVSRQVGFQEIYYTEYAPTGDENPNQGPLDSDAYHNPGYVGNTYDFIIKQISTSRKEVRLKLLNHNLKRNTDGSVDYSIQDIINQLTQNNPTTGYKFNHLLNVGDGKHIPITNFEFDAVTDGKENQSIILRLYKPLPLGINNQKLITIESEKLITQTTEIYYFSDVEPQVIGLGLNPDNLDNWINPNQTENLEFQNYDELTSSLSDNALKQYTSGSSHYYPNLNVDFNEFANHTFFGSAKKKLENFNTKVSTIQGHYSKISSSLNTLCSIDADSTSVIQLRKDYFNKINKEIQSFTPYERFLYYNGQSDSTASAPSLVNYADTIPIAEQYKGDEYKGQINGGDGFDVVYHHSSENIEGKYIDIFTDKYFAHNKPFFNYSSSIYLSFLMKADSGSAFSFENRQRNGITENGVSFPQDSKFKENLLEPKFTGSAYQRYIFHTSHSYFIPTAEVDTDFSRISNFNVGSSEIEILSGSFKTGSALVRDSSGKYQNYSTVVTGSGIKFKGSVMPAGELFRIYYKNELAEDLQALYRFDEGSGTTATDTSGNSNNGTLKNGATYDTDGVVNTALSLDGTNDYVELAADAFGNLSSTDFSITAWINPNDDIAEFDVIVGKRADSNGSGFIFDLRDKTGENDGAHPFGIGFSLEGSALVTVDSSATIAKDEYSHVAAVVDRDANVKLYVNGVQVGSSTIDLTDQGSEINVSNKIGIGARIADDGATLSNKFPGKIDEVRFYRRTLTANEVNNLYLHPDGITENKITDVKITLDNPKNALPFDNLFHTSSTEWTNWYDDLLTKAGTFDTNNIHSLENNLPLYIQESSEYGDLKDFLSLQGEQYDVIKNHIDGLNTIHTRGYNELDSAPENIYPILLDNIGYQAINPFSGSLSDSLGSYLSGVTSIDDIKTNTWRKTLNNLIYIYKSKGTKNAVRGLLNVYGYPPDIISMNEFGTGYEESQGNNNPINDSNPVPSDSNVDLDLLNQSDSVQFSSKDKKLFNFMFQNKPLRAFNLEWYRNNADINTIEFIYKHNSSTNTQTILESSGSSNQRLWDLRLVPSADGLSSSFEFRLNNSNTGSGAIATNALSMSTVYSKISDGQLWNVMLQRMTSSISGSGTNEYRLHTAFQNDKQIETYNYVTMSVSGGLSNSYITGAADVNYYANQNFVLTGSRVTTDSSNLVVGRTLSGSLAEIKAWNSPLIKSKFRLHTLNKFSIVGNTINSHKDELIYHFKLNENYILHQYHLLLN